MSEMSLQELQKIVFKERDCIIIQAYRHLSTRVTLRLIHTNLKPWHISLAVIATGFVSAFFFLQANYVYLIAGVFFAQLSFLLDRIDGELARVKKQCSPFGDWLDAFGDFITNLAIYSAIAIGLFWASKEPIVLLVGIIALCNIAIMMFVATTKKVMTFATTTKKEAFDSRKINPTLKLSSKYYLGGRSILLEVLSIGALLNATYYVLLFFATFGFFMWLKTVFELVKEPKI